MSFADLGLASFLTSAGGGRLRSAGQRRHHSDEGRAGRHGGGGQQVESARWGEADVRRRVLHGASSRQRRNRCERGEHALVSVIGEAGHGTVEFVDQAGQSARGMEGEMAGSGLGRAGNRGGRVGRQFAGRGVEAVLGDPVRSQTRHEQMTARCVAQDLIALPSPFWHFLSMQVLLRFVLWRLSAPPVRKACMRIAVMVGIMPLLLMTARGNDWPQWMGGPQNNGSWSEEGSLTNFPAAGLAAKWRTPIRPLPTGASSFAATVNWSLSPLPRPYARRPEPFPWQVSPPQATGTRWAAAMDVARSRSDTAGRPLAACRIKVLRLHTVRADQAARWQESGRRLS